MLRRMPDAIVRVGEDPWAPAMAFWVLANSHSPLRIGLFEKKSDNTWQGRARGGGR